MNVDEWSGTLRSQDKVDQAIDWIVLLDKSIDTSQKDNNAHFKGEPVELGLMKLDEHKRAEFFNWLNEDVSHQYLFADCSELWAKTTCIKSFQQQLKTSNVLAFPSKDSGNKSFNQNEVNIMAEYHSCASAPAWAYQAVIGLIVIGMTIPLIF